MAYTAEKTFPVGLTSVADLNTYVSGNGAVYNRQHLYYTFDGELSVETGTASWVATFACTLVDVRLSVGTAPTGAAILVDVHKDGTTVFTTQGNRPTVAAGSTEGSAATPDVTSIAADDVLTVDVDQIGSTVAGSDLRVVFSLKGA